jgi:mRNA interferase MazF
MVVPAVGEIVLVTFPFSDLSQAKLRPAVCLAAAGRADWILCQITSNSYGDPFAIALQTTDFDTGGLRVASFARPGKLFTASARLMQRSVGKLHASASSRIADAVIQLLKQGRNP